MGLLLFEQKLFAEAVGVFQEALRQDPGHRDARFYLAVTYEEMKRYDEALAELTQIPESARNYAEVLIHTGYVLGQLERLKDSADAFAKALIVNPGDPQVLYLLGVTQMRRKDFPQAILHLKEAAALRPDNAGYSYQLGAAYERNRQLKEAEAAFRQTLRLDPKHADAYNYLGYMFAEEGIKLEESVRLIREALTLEPENSAFLDSLGWAYYKLGRLDEALRELLKAVQHGEKDDATIRDHLGQVYFDKGMVREAIEQWERALSLEGGNEAIQKRLERARGLISRGAS